MSDDTHYPSRCTELFSQFIATYYIQSKNTVQQLQFLGICDAELFSQLIATCYNTVASIIRDLYMLSFTTTGYIGATVFLR